MRVAVACVVGGTEFSTSATLVGPDVRAFPAGTSTTGYLSNPFRIQAIEGTRTSRRILASGRACQLPPRPTPMERCFKRGFWNGPKS